MLYLLVVVAALVGAPEARAEIPIYPKLTATSPPSSEAAPASTTTPLVFGEGEPEGGVIIRGTGPRAFAGGGFIASAGKPTQNPSFEVLIYGEAECQGGVIGSGDAASLEGTGIPATVAADALTVLSAVQIDPVDRTHPSVCSAPFLYWEGNVSSGGGSGGGSDSGGGGLASGGSGGSGDASGASGGVGPAVTAGKPDAPKILMTPAATANDNVPTVVGSAPGAGSVVLYANAGCSGTPVASGSPAQLAAGISVQVGDNTTTSFSAVAVGGQRSNCSSPVTYVEDSTAPRTRVTMGPGMKTHRRRAVFRFADVTLDPPGTSFFCKVDRRRWRPCSSPFRLGRLRLGRYIVRFRAIDLAGNAERAGAKRIFSVVPHS